jgi:hypothetical protein
MHRQNVMFRACRSRIPRQSEKYGTSSGQMEQIMTSQQNTAPEKPGTTQQQHGGQPSAPQQQQQQQQQGTAPVIRDWASI